MASLLEIGVSEPPGLPVAAAAALALMPENSDHEEQVQAAVSALADDPDLALAQCLSDVVIATGGEDESESEQPCFCTEIVTDGGSYLLVENSDIAVYALQQMLKAIFQSRPALPAAGFVDAARSVVGTALSLVDAAARDAGLQRLEPDRPHSSSALAVPDPELWQLLTQAVTFDQQRLWDVARWWSRDAQERLQRSHDGDEDLGVDAPLLQVGEVNVLVGARTMAQWLCRELVVLASEHETLEEFNDRWMSATHDSVLRDVRRLGATPLHEHLGEADGITDAVFRLDTDKALHLVCAHDQLEPAADPRKVAADPLRARLDEVATELLCAPSPPNEVLQLVVVSAAGRPLLCALPRPQLPVERIMLGACDVETLSYARARDAPLNLRNWARAWSRLQATTQVVCVDPLDAYALWEGNDCSFYLSDDAHPTTLVIPPGSGGTLRGRALRRADIHGVSGPDHNTLVDVVRISSNPDEKVYMPLWLAALGRPAWVAEGGEAPIWVLGHPPGTTLTHTAVAYGEMLAFWLCQLGSRLDPFLEHLAGQPRPVVVELSLAGTDDEWHLPNPATSGTLGTIEPQGPTELQIVLHPTAGQGMRGPDNRGEREVVKLLLRGLMQLTSSAANEAVVEQLTQEVAPLGPKRRMTHFLTNERPELDPTGLTRSRGRPTAPAAEVLDQLGAHLLAVRPVGPLPNNERTVVLNEAAEFHAQQLANAVAQMGDDLLPELIGDYEAIVHEQAQREQILPNQVACYGGESEFVQRLQSDVPDHAAQAGAARLLLEYVAARPPQGLRAYSRSAHDELLAIAEQLISRGQQSDLIKHGLDEKAHLSILDSGRLGYRQAGYQAARSRFLGDFAQAALASSVEHHAATWDTPGEVSAAYIEELNQCTREEFGLALQGQVEFLFALERIGSEQDSRACSMPLPELKRAVPEAVELSSSDIDRAIELLCLGPRPDFWTPPEGFPRKASWPWYFNRQLSHVRRPLIIRHEEGGPTAWWGRAHVSQTGQHLVYLAEAGLIQAQTGPLSRLMRSHRDQAAERFNDEVADACDLVPGLVVERRVLKLGGQRLARSSGEILGDVDVLAAHPGHRILWVIDAKHLVDGRMPHQLANDFEKTFALDGPKRSKAQIHQERIEYVKAHRGDALHALGLDPADAGGWRVEGRFVLANDMLAPYLIELPFEVMTFRRLRHRLSEAGVP